ncbi:DNA-binding transcriptional MocR family regulator [Murinocardiopsis flavida]|uniref:DNA-binding transcriptional MocR family regulator n=1 Tax=Murinocardiopsis flavida TaxID=645275 RepID=A0A2P8DSM3_9ACTN|nr:PLP-dependent aminotransferase family protein [Murinocardiopsis flavida]PSL00208.1 DNA-binding transcriptional MocR family regulator [Murinocardiopsis flavida]
MAAGTRRINGHLLARLIGRDGRARPYYLSVGRSISGLILDGRIPTHTRLPAERDLADSLGLSRNTVTASYTWLRENGFLDSRRGAGSWTLLPSTAGNNDSVLLPRSEPIDLGIAAPPAIEGMQAAARMAVEQLAAHVGGRGYTTFGLPELRHAVARRYVERGLPTEPDQILITNGAQHAAALLMELLVQPGDSVLLESPTFPHTLDTVRQRGARLRTMGVGPNGWEMDVVADAFRQGRPKAAFVIPDFHNPTGALMDDDERAALVAEARRAGSSLIVDESVAELAIDPGDQPAPTAVHDRDGRVFSIGSTAKLFWGGLRIGWIRTTPPMAARLMALRQRFDLSSPVLEQLTATHLLADVLRIRAERIRQVRRNRDALVAALRAELPEWRFVTPSGGLVLWARLPAPTATALTEAADRNGVHAAPGPIFGTEGTLEHFVRLAYTQPPEVLHDGVRRLARAHAETAARPAAQPRGPYL